MGLFGIVLLAVLLWIGVGWLLLYWGARPAGRDYRRSIDRGICTKGEKVEVTLRHIPPATHLAKDRDMVLVLDHSSSMGWAAGSPLREAIRAAENFVRRLPENIHLGVIAFDHEAQLLCAVTENHRKVLRAIGSIGPGGGTEIHLALDQCHEALDGGRPNIPKTIILLSDGGSDSTRALEAAERLRNHPAQPQIICAGFGPQVHESLLTDIAGERGTYLHVDKTEDLETLFAVLAGVMTGQAPVAGLIDEGIFAPRPFEFSGSGGLYPIAVEPAKTTRILWSMPVMGREVTPVSYTVEAACLGWWAIASADSKVTWRMPDGTIMHTPGPRSPRVLVLPRWLGWTWPVLNPLFWLLVKPLVKCLPPPVTAQTPVFQPLPTSTLPEPLPAPEGEVFVPTLRPALVIGLGLSGEEILCRLKHRLWDRGVDDPLVEFVNVQLGDPENRPQIKVGEVSLTKQERYILNEDLRPYLEGLRDSGIPPTRDWIPVRQWLAKTQPLTTVRGAEGDRRVARLALLRQPEPLEAGIRASASRILDANGLVIVVGAAGDAETSGLLGEVAHMCAAAHLSVTAILASARRNEETDRSVMGLVQELERMIILRGEEIASDRQEPPILARQLFDRILVVGEELADPAENSRAVAEAVWSLLCSPDILTRMPIARGATCYRFHHRGVSLPQVSLWMWVRERTLVAAINQQWLGLQENDASLVLPPPNEQLTRESVQTFWSGTGLTRSQGALLRTGSAILHQNSSLLSLLESSVTLPSDKPYHEQKAFCEQQRWQFSAYVEEWCQMVLKREQENGHWPVSVLLQAVTAITADLERLSERISTLSGNSDFANLAGFASGLLMEYRSVLRNLGTELEAWRTAFVGHLTSVQPNGLQTEMKPVCLAVQVGYDQAERNLTFPTPQARAAAEDEYQRWLPQYRDELFNQLRYEIQFDPKTNRLDLRLRLAERWLAANDDIVAALRDFLDRYRKSVFRWPFAASLVPNAVAAADQWFLIGQFARAVFPAVREVVDDRDPFIAAAVRIAGQELRNAFLMAAFHPHRVVYVWPEEANAARIANKIRNVLERDPEPFTSPMIALMRDTGKLYGFLSDLAHGRVSLKAHRVILERDGVSFEIGPSDERLTGLDAFEAIVRQAVALEVSLTGQKLPPPKDTWVISPDEAVQAVQNNPLVAEATQSPEWAVWQDVIRGLALEHGRAAAWRGSSSQEL